MIGLERVRELCLALPETNERESHGRPAFYIRDKKTFAMFMDNTTAPAASACGARRPTGCRPR